MPPSQFDLLLEAAFWVLGIGLALAVLLPPIMTVVGRSRVTCTHISPLPEVWARDFPIHPELYEELSDQGFQLLGGIRLQYWSWFNSWCHTRTCRVFGGEYTGCFALVSRPIFRGRDQIAFITLLKDGGWIWTANFPWLQPAKCEQHRSQTILRGFWGARQRETRYLMQQHRQAVAKFQWDDRQLIAHTYLPVLVDSYPHWTNRRNKQERLREWICLLLTALTVAVLGFGIYAISTLFRVLPVVVLCVAWPVFLVHIWSEWSESRAKPGMLGWLERRMSPASDPQSRKKPEASDDAPAPLDPDTSQAIRPPETAD